MATFLQSGLMSLSVLFWGVLFCYCFWVFFLQVAYTHISDFMYCSFPTLCFSPTSINFPLFAVLVLHSHCFFFLNLIPNYVMILGKVMTVMSFLVTRFKQPMPDFVTPTCHSRIFLGKSPSLFINDQKKLWIWEMNKMAKWTIKKKVLYDKVWKTYETER